MRFDRRFLIVVGCSLLWAFIVASVFYRAVASGAQRRVPGKPLVVAAQALPFGALLTADAVKIVEVPETMVPKGAFSRLDDVLERSVTSPIEPDEPIVAARIAARGSGVGLAPMIPPGLRAIAVKVNEVVGVAGFVLPGMRVDVLVTGHPPNGNDTVTTTVLQNIPVLSAGQTIQADTKGQPISATVVTLLVSPAEAEGLTLANSEGHIQLVLRNNSDQQLTRPPGRQSKELYAIDARAPSPPAASPTLPAPRPAAVKLPRIVPVSVAPTRVTVPSPDEVIMIRGNQKTVEAALPRTGN